MSPEQKKRVVEMLIEAMERVAKEKTAITAEAEALARIAAVLIEYDKRN